MEKENDNNSEVKNNETVLNDEDNLTSEEKVELSVEDKLKEMEDKLARSYAELENQRRRYEKEKDEAYEFGGMALAKECLNLTDNLERSKLSIINDQSLDKNNKDKIIEHIEIIYKDIMSTFNKNQIEEIISLGKKFDPNKHQAMLEVEDENKEQGLVVQEIQKGFTLKNRLLRPSLVGVSKKPRKNEEKHEKNEEN
tara:strand:- start:419 stop:1009 length:591 start_codon:yes stop_codon:yes gene_type:complete